MGSQRVFSSTTRESINSSVLSLLYGSTLTSIHDHISLNIISFLLFTEEKCTCMSPKFSIILLNKTTCEKSLWFHVNTIGKHQNHRGIFKSRMSKGIFGTLVWLVVKGACYCFSRTTLITGNPKKCIKHLTSSCDSLLLWAFCCV